jgi:predicted KAP-like P-loop ATPase
MRLVIPPLPIDEQDSFKHDALGRKQFGIALMNLITKTNDGLVISLDAPWGEGKTTFVKMWRGLLKESQIRNIYFDAFANDYVDDAFIAVLWCMGLRS